MGQHRTRKTKQEAIHRREEELQHLYSLSQIAVQKAPEVSKDQKKLVSSVFAFDRSFFYRDLLKTVFVTATILALELMLWQRLK